MNHPQQGLEQIYKLAGKTNQRPLIWIVGNYEQAIHSLFESLDQLGFQSPVYVSKKFTSLQKDLEGKLLNSQVHICKHKSHLLGTQTDCLIYDGFHGFDPDLFCSASGSLKAGGILFLLSPDEEQWIANGDVDYERMVVYPLSTKDVKGRFIERLLRYLNEGDVIAKLNAATRLWDKSIDERSLVTTSVPHHQAMDQSVTYSDDQVVVINGVTKVIEGHRNRPLVVTADRGRGKSAAIGAAISQQNKPIHALVTAPNFDNVKVLFDHCVKGLNGAKIQGNAIHHHDLKLEFVATDELIHCDKKPNLLIVDEAAAIPEAMLQNYLNHFHRVVFSTTVHGYEGTGRGFQIRFVPYLDKACPGWQQVELTQPIRWGDNDQLETWVNKTFLLSADYEKQPEPIKNISAELIIELVTQQQLHDNQSLLEQVYGLLIQAHYRTSPGDLRDLLDALNFSVFLVKKDNVVVGCCLIAEEGGLDPDITEKIFLGERRVRGHLLPQAMCQHLGVKSFAAKNIARVVRIAIAPEFQDQGLGSFLLSGVEKHYRHIGFEHIGSSFSAYPNVVQFWGKNDYCLVRLGFSKEASSGAHSLMILKSLGGECSELNKVSEMFFSEFLHLLSNEFSSLPHDIILTMLHYMAKCGSRALGYSNPGMVDGFVSGARSFQNARASLYGALVKSFNTDAFIRLDESDKLLLVELLLKQSTLKAVQNAGLIKGKKQGVEQLRNIFAKF